MTIFYINQNLIGSRLVRAPSFICTMNFFAFISEDAGGWLWFLGNLVTKLSLVFTVPGIVFLCTFPVDDIFLGDYIHKYQLGMLNEHCPIW